MKIAAQQLQTHLQKSLAPIYFLTSEELLFLDEAVANIKKHAESHGYHDSEIYHIENNFDWDAWFAQTRMQSLFSQKSFIEMRVAKFNDQAKKTLDSYAKDPDPDKIIVVTTGKMDASSLKTKWFQAIEEKSVFIQFWPLTIEQLPSWTKTRASEKQLSIDQAACERLAYLCEGNIAALAQAIEKLKLLFPQTKINIDNVEYAIADSAHFDVFQFVDEVLKGERTRSLTMLAALQAEGIESAIILWALTRELRVLYELSFLISQGQNLEKVIQESKVWQKRKSLVKSALTRHNANTLKSLLMYCQKIDSVIKGAQKGNVWDMITQLVIKI